MWRRYADIRGLEGYRRGADTLISGSGGDIGVAPMRRYPGLGGYRCGADTPISGSGGISVRRRHADIQGWGDIGVSVYRCGADLEPAVPAQCRQVQGDLEPESVVEDRHVARNESVLQERSRSAESTKHLHIICIGLSSGSQHPTV